MSAMTNPNSNTTSATAQTTMEVRLLGQKLTLKSTEEDPEIIRQIIHVASARLSEAEINGRGAPPHQIALLALLDLAEEYVKAKRRTLDYQTQLDEKSSKLLSLVENEYR